VALRELLPVVELFVRRGTASKVRDLKSIGVVRRLLHHTLPVRLREYPRVAQVIAEGILVGQQPGVSVVAHPAGGVAEVVEGFLICARAVRVAVREAGGVAFR